MLVSFALSILFELKTAQEAFAYAMNGMIYQKTRNSASFQPSGQYTQDRTLIGWRLHQESSSAWHRNLYFLPAHRMLLQDFERELVRVDPNAVLPYWDWTRHAGRPSADLIWNYFSRDGRVRYRQCFRWQICFISVSPLFGSRIE